MPHVILQDIYHFVPHHLSYVLLTGMKEIRNIKLDYSDSWIRRVAIYKFLQTMFQVSSKDQTPGSLLKQEIRLEPAMVNLIEETRREVTSLDEQQRFVRAQIHLEDALKYKNSRIDRFDPEQPLLYSVALSVQTHMLWGTLVQVMSFLYMYLILLEHTSLDSFYRIASFFGLTLFWTDLFLELLHSSRDKARRESKFPQIFYVRVGLLLLLLGELTLVQLGVENDAGRPINPLRVLRGLLPIVYVCEVRRSFQALLSAYEQFLVFILFECVVVLIFALVGNSIIQLPEGTATDAFTNNYGSLGNMIFIVYVTGSYDAFPDNQLLAFSISQWFQIFFLLFVFLNMFLFSSIPASLLFDSYIETRSKYILLDEIKMQHSLILAFISLGEHNYETSIQTVVDFLHFLYGHQVNYVDAITELCLKINDDGNCSVHVLQFIRIGRILQENPYLKPSALDRVPLWLPLKRALARNCPSCPSLSSPVINVILSLAALLGAIIGLACLFSDAQGLVTFEMVLSCLFLVDVCLRVAGQGLENYLMGEWNLLDLGLITLSFILSVIFGLHTFSGLLKLVRLFRVYPLLIMSFQNEWINVEFGMLEKFKRLLGTVIIILPLIFRFIPLFLIVYYLLGIAGMEIFYDLTRQEAASASIYDSLSNFKTLINTQYYLVQVLTEAGWSAVAFDFAARAGTGWGLALLFFVLCHIVVVLVLAAVLKGIIWFVFITVTQLLDAQERSQKSAQARKQDMAEQVKNISEVEENIKASSLFTYDTVMKRTLFQSKANCLILQQFAVRHEESKGPSSPKVIDNKLYPQFESDRGLLQRLSGPPLQTSGNSFLFSMISGIDPNNGISLYDKEEVEEEDIDEYLNRLLKAFKINTTRFQFQIEHNALLSKHLLSRLTAPYLREERQSGSESKSELQEFGEKKTLDFHIFTLHLILNMTTKRYTQKSLVLKELTQEGEVDECHVKHLMARRLGESSFQVDDDCVVRQMYLQDTNKSFIDKFQAEYFSDIFGPSFKEINKVTIEPLIHLQSTLTYALKKLARSPQINHLQFFKILGEIQFNISNCLLKKGSLFKLVYQVKARSNSWFTVQYTSLNETKVSFLKHGLWMPEDKLIQNQIYYGRDIFKTGKELEKEELLTRAALMKKLYESYETLALAVPNNYSFFQSNPTFHQYDTFLTYINVGSLQRLVPKPFEIHKIMAVMLTKEEERQSTEPLEYPISDIRIKPPEDLIDFKIDEAEDQTYLKLGRLFDLNDEEITANEGLPYAYVLNFLCEISDTLKLYAPNFVHQAEKVLNEALLKPDNLNQ